MNTRQSWKTVGTVVLVFLGGMAIILASFALNGFPFPGDPTPQVAWIELVVLLILLGIPLFR